MVKRSAAIVLAMLYVFTASGFVLNFHYCFNRLSSFNIDAPANPCVQAMQTCKMKCCKDQHIEIKVKDNHQAVSPSFLSKFFIADLPALLAANFSYSLQNTSGTNICPYRGPPEPPGTPIYLTNCIFRI